MHGVTQQKYFFGQARTLTGGVRFLLLFVLLSAPLAAQVLVPFDRDSTQFIVTGQFEQQTSFLGIPRLHDARIIREQDGRLTLFLTIADSAGYRVERRSLAPEDLSFYRDRYGLIVRDRLSHVASSGSEENDGSTGFVQTMTGLGLSWYGFTFPAAFDLDGSAAIGLYLVTGAGSYFFADGYASSRRITAGEGEAFRYFATRGILHGYAILATFQGSDVNHRIAFPVATLTSLGEGFIMMGIAGRRQWPESYVSTLGTYGDAGLLLGISVGYLSGEGSSSIATDIGDNPGRYAGSVLLTSAVGFALGTYAASAIDYAPGDAPVQESIGYLGAAAGYTVADASKGASNSSKIVGTTIGFVGGQALGAYMASKLDLSGDDATRVRLLTSGGILFGLGVAYIISGGELRSAGFVGSGVAGGTVGMIYALSRTGPATAGGGRGRASLQVRPDGLIVPYTIDRARGTARLHPFLSVQFTF